MGLYLTPTEAGELDEAIRELLFERFGERRTRTESTPADAERIELLTFSYRV